MVFPDEYAAQVERVCASRLTFAQYDAYYRGEQRASFWSPHRRHDRDRRRSMVVNLPRLIVDSLEDRLDVEGFRFPGQDNADGRLWQWWQDNSMDVWSQQAHLHALVHGRSFVLVGEDDGEPVITVESAAQVYVELDARRRVRSAIKVWNEADRGYATHYGWDFTSQWWATEAARGGMSAGLWRQRAEPIPNVLGRPAVVPFINRPDLHRPLGESELVDVIPVADAINELATDLLETAEYHAAPRRWATGIDLGGSEDETERTAEKMRQRWEEARSSKVWATDSAEARFGQFPEASLSNFIESINLFTGHAAALGSLPPHFLGVNADNPASADAIRAAESSLLQKAYRKQRVFGEAWEDVMRLALEVADGGIPEEARRLETIWRDAATPTVAQKADAAVKLTQAGVIDPEQAQEDLGYTPVQIERMSDRRVASALAPVRAQLEEAARLQREQGLSQPAAYAAVGLLQSAALQAQQP